MVKARARREGKTLGLYASVFETPKGQEVIEDLRRLFLDKPSYIAKETDADEVVYREGQKRVVRYMLDRIAESKTPPQRVAETTEGT